MANLIYIWCIIGGLFLFGASCAIAYAICAVKDRKETLAMIKNEFNYGYNCDFLPAKKAS